MSRTKKLVTVLSLMAVGVVLRCGDDDKDKDEDEARLQSPAVGVYTNDLPVLDDHLASDIRLQKARLTPSRGAISPKTPG